MSDIVTELVQLNGGSLSGYVARPQRGGPYPGVIVIQEWWGLVPHIRDVAERFARAGFVALAPDLYHGATTTEPDEAGKLMMALDMPRAAGELVKAADWLASQRWTEGRGIGVVGFCMGGALALTLACDSPRIAAAVSFYGKNPEPVLKVATLSGPVKIFYAEGDDWVTADDRAALQAALQQHGKEHEIVVYPQVPHAFFNDDRPEVHHPEFAADTWKRMLEFFHARL